MKKIAKIHCNISNCHYWEQGNVCYASEILVSKDAWAAQAPDQVDALQATNIPSMSADSCMDTCCKTFVEKGTAEIKADQVTKNS